MVAPDLRSTGAGDPLPRILELLGMFHVVTLACRDARGSWAAPVFFAHDGLDLIFLSSPNSRHARALAFDSHLAGVVHGPADDWQSIVGLQLSGDVRPLTPDEVPAARAAFARRFPFIDGAAQGHEPGLAAALQRAMWYRLRVSEAVVVDNTKGLGQRVVWSRPVC